jgi:hypothetical protein
MAFKLFFLWALAMQPPPAAVIVRASGDCPSAGAVTGALAKLLAPAALSDRSLPADLAEIEVRGATLVISLRRDSGEIVGQRELAAPAGCADRAEAAAIVLAAWETHLGDRPARDLQLDRQREATLPSVAATTPPAPSFVGAEIPAPSVQLPKPAVVRAVGPLGVSAAERRRLVLVPGGSLFASVDANDTALGAAAEVVWSRPGSPFALGGSALVVASHATTVSPGVGSWRRFGLVVDGRRRAAWPSAWLEARIGLALTALAISGSALGEASGGITLDPGALVGLRVGLAGGPAVSWLEIAATAWPRRQTVYVRGGGSADLPRLEALLGVGLSWGRP